MKFFYKVLLAVLSGCGVLCAAGIGGDCVPSAETRRTPQELSDNRTRALEFYLAGLMEKDHAKKVDLLLEAFTLDPGSRLPLIVLMKNLNRASARLPQVRQRLEEIRRRYPMDVFLAVQAGVLDKAYGISPEKILPYMEVILRRKPAGDDRKYFHQLALSYIDLLLKTPAETVLLPFEADDARLQGGALYYYALRAQRDQLALKKSIAPEQCRKYTGLLRKQNFRTLPELRAHLALLQMSGSRQLAFETAGKFLEKNRNIYSVMQYIETAADSGNLEALEKALARYRIFTADFCARMRYQCRIRRGEFDRAVEETHNFSDPAEREIRILFAVRAKGDSDAIRKSLKRLESAAKPDKNTIFLTCLHLAELDGDVKMFEKAEKICGKQKWSDPLYANSLGYVLAVLGIRLDEAQKLLTFALLREPNNAAYLDSMAWICYKRKDYRKALEYMQKAFACLSSVVSGTAVMADHTGDIYSALGEQEKAVRCYQLALKLFENDRSGNADLNLAALKKKLKAAKK